MIFCFVGIFLTLPIAFIGMYHMAKQLTDGGGSGGGSGDGNGLVITLS